MAPALTIRRDEARRYVLQAKLQDKKVGLVPTMGALHQGHLSLVKASCFDCDYTVVSIFVNPTQFGPGEDYEAYPRDLERDIQQLQDVGVDLVFAPDTGEIYHERHSTTINPPSVAEPLEGVHRPHHFRGVATVVLKLFNIVPADVAFFGQKDFQQTRVIEAMVADLDLPMSIQVCPVIRESDGLALSSRNAYLTDCERTQAVALSQALTTAVKMSRGEQNDAAAICAAMTAQLHQAGIIRIDYVAIVDPVHLRPVEIASPGSMALIAAHVGATRLIDNARLG